MRMQVGFPYSTPALSAETRARLQPLFREPIPDPLPSWGWEGVAEVPDVFAAAPEIEFKVSGGELPATAWEVVSRRLAAIEAKVAAPAAPVNERCRVVVPGLGLLVIDEVDVATDYCTERLQERLTEGWRILAICPQPDQRRPDYVLGRTRTTEGR